MRIWIFNHDASTPDQQFTGPYDLARSLVERGHEITIFASSFSHYKFTELRLQSKEKWRVEGVEGVRFIWLRTFPYCRNDFRRIVNMLSYGWRAFWTARKLGERPDAIIGATVHPIAAFTAYVLSLLNKSPFFFELRDLWPLNLIQVNALSSNSPFAWGLNALEKFLLKKSAKTISVLPYAGEYVASRGIPSENVVWIPSGLDLSRYADLKPYDGKTRDPFTLMYIGGHVYSNALDVILRAAKIQQSQSGPQVRFVFVGGGQEKANLVKFANDLELRNIEFRDVVPKNRLYKVMEEADAFVLSLRDLPMYKYGNNLNKLHDYLASGRPIIFATNGRYNPVKAAGAGLTVPAESPEEVVQAISKLIAMSPEQRVQMGKNGRRYAEKQLDVRLLASRLEEVLRSSIETPTEPPAN